MISSGEMSCSYRASEGFAVAPIDAVAVRGGSHNNGGPKLNAILLSLTLLFRVPASLAHTTAPASAREVFVCESLLRLANPQASWDHGSLSMTLLTLREGRGRLARAAISELRRDLRTLPDAAFPVRQVLIGPELIRHFLSQVDEASRRLEVAHRPELARRPFTVQSRFVSDALTGLSGLGASALSMLFAGACVIGEHPVWGVLGAVAAAGCTHGVVVPSVGSVWAEMLNSDLLATHHRRAPSTLTTAQSPAHEFQRFTSAVRLGLESSGPGHFVWAQMRTRLPLSQSDRPTHAGSPRAPTAHELAAAVRRSGEFWFPRDARILKVDLILYFDVGYGQPVLLTFVRE